ncbi:MAG: metallophosphoesterase [Chloroflexi bacterium]|nr:metallophosphoesterase [Chloroflexota bacterium]
MIKILHTADIHLGKKFPFLLEKGKEYRNQLLKTFDKIIDLAISENVSLILIAGDLFDTNYIHGITIGKVLAAFNKLAEKDIHVCILPGTHDVYDNDCIYRFVSFPPNVFVFTPEVDNKFYENLDLTVYGKVLNNNISCDNPLRGLNLNSRSQFHFGLAHCSIKIEGFMEQDAMLLAKKDISESGLDYLALGHWHSYANLSQGNTLAFYCGSPEPISMDQKGSGYVNIVSIINKGNIHIEPVTVSSKIFDSISIDTGLIKTMESVIALIEQKANPNLILEVTLTGFNELDLNLESQGIEDILKDKFFYLKVLDKTVVPASHPSYKEIPEDTIAGKFIAIMENKINASINEEKQVFEEALKLGYALLQGKEHLIE